MVIQMAFELDYPYTNNKIYEKAFGGNQTRVVFMGSNNGHHNRDHPFRGIIIRALCYFES